MALEYLLMLGLSRERDAHPRKWDIPVLLSVAGALIELNTCMNGFIDFVERTI